MLRLTSRWTKKAASHPLTGASRLPPVGTAPCGAVRREGLSLATLEPIAAVPSDTEAAPHMQPAKCQLLQPFQPTALGRGKGKLREKPAVEMTVGESPKGQASPNLGNRDAIPTFPPPGYCYLFFQNLSPKEPSSPPAPSLFRLILRLEKTGLCDVVRLGGSTAPARGRRR